MKAAGCAIASLLACILLVSGCGPRRAHVASADRKTLQEEFDELVRRSAEEYKSLGEKNAAIHYRAAVAALPEPLEDEDFDFLMTFKLNTFPPRTIYEIEGAVEEIKRYAAAIPHLRRGARMEGCNFGEDWSKGFEAPQDYLYETRNLTRRAAAYGKYLEAEGRPVEAASVYLDIMRLGYHVAQEPTLMSYQNGTVLLGVGVWGVKGVLASDPGVAALEILAEGLSKFPSRPLNLPRAVNTERIVTGGWCRQTLLDGLDQGLEKVRAKLNPGGRHPMREVFAQAAESLLKERIESWFREYSMLLKRLARAAEGTYYSNRNRMAKMSFLAEAYARNSSRRGNQIILLLFPGIPGKHKEARCETSIAGVKLLAAAMLERAKTGKCPGSLEDIKKHFHGGLPVDPFTGKPFQYHVENGLPVFECEGEGPETKKKFPEWFIFSPAARRAYELERLEKWRKERAAKKAKQPPAAGG